MLIVRRIADWAGLGDMRTNLGSGWGLLRLSRWSRLILSHWLVGSRYMVPDGVHHSSVTRDRTLRSLVGNMLIRMRKICVLV